MIFTILLYSLPLLLFLKIVKTYIQLSSIPGPLVNKFSNIPRLLSVYNRTAHDDQLSLHKHHGDIVRLGPNMVSIAGGTLETNYVQQIYGIGKGLIKSDFYAVFQNVVGGKRAASLVAMTDETQHAKTKRTIAHAYSLSTLVEFEPLVDSTTEVFLKELEMRFCQVDDNENERSESRDEKKFTQQSKPCDLGRWLQFYAFDVIGELTFSKRLGFIETGEDVNDIIRSIGANFDYFSVLGQMPWMDEAFLGKNPIYVKYFRKSVASPILQFAQQLLKERLQGDDEQVDNTGDESKNREETTKDIKQGGNTKPDFLTRFLQIRKETQEPMTDGQILSLLFMNINAGSDTIASTLRAIFYYLLTNPSTLEKLMAELTTAQQNGHLTLPCPTWTETQSEHTSYLRAVIKEGIRMNPALSLPLERVVPKGGMTLKVRDDSSWKEPQQQDMNNQKRKNHQDDENKKNREIFLQEGTIIGINPYVHHRSPSLFGHDAENWNPDRWLVSSSSSSTTQDEEQNKKIKEMESQILSFGAGKRTCMGRNIAMMEMYKLVPAVLMSFDITPSSERIDLDAKTFEGMDEMKRKFPEWVVRNSWVLSAEGLNVTLRKR